MHRIRRHDARSRDLRLFAGGEHDVDTRGHFPGDVLLQREEVADVALERRAPQQRARARLVDLHVHLDGTTGAAGAGRRALHRALDDRARAGALGHVLERPLAADVEPLHERPRHHLHGADVAKPRGQLHRDRARQVRLVRIGRQILEGQHRQYPDRLALVAPTRVARSRGIAGATRGGASAICRDQRRFSLDPPSVPQPAAAGSVVGVAVSSAT
jgi:hypothetical protein